MKQQADPGERDRLKALYELRILDTERQPDFDAVVELAQDLFHVPISAVSLIDHDRQWFKAITGLNARETPRDLAFCNHTIRSSRPFIVSDAAKDRRFKENPLVTSNPSIRFYAGVPLAVNPGINLGSLCIIDNQPREIDDETIRRLNLLGEITVSLLKQHKMALDSAQLYTKSVKQAAVITRQSAALANQKRLLDDASRIARIGAWERNNETGRIEWSDGMFALHEMDRTSPIDSSEILARYPEPDRSRLVGLLETAAKDNRAFSFEGRMYTAKGNLRWVRLESQVDIMNGQVVRRIGFQQDITEQKAMADWIRRLAEVDDLTGVFNRRVLQDRLMGHRSATGDSAGVCLLILDLDGFKEVNDTYGHGAGDACLKQIARRLTSLDGRRIVVARLGGDEFGILRLGNPIPDVVAKLATRISHMVSNPIKWRGHALQLSSSVGISTRAKGQKFDPAELMREADLALYDAKNAGRSCYRLFQPAMSAAITEKAETLREVAKALSLNQLEL